MGSKAANTQLTPHIQAIVPNMTIRLGTTVILIAVSLLVPRIVAGDTLEKDLEQLWDSVSEAHSKDNPQRILEITNDDFFTDIVFEELEDLENTAWPSMEQFYYLAIASFRARAFFDTADHRKAIEAYEKYLEHAIDPQYFDYTNLAKSYVHENRIERASEILLQSLSRIAPDQFIWIYSARNDIIEDHGNKKDFIEWAEAVYPIDPRASIVFGNAANAAFELKRDELGTLWFFRAFSIQYDMNGMPRDPLISLPETEFFRRTAANKDSSILDFCRWFYWSYNSQYMDVEPIELKEMRQSAERSSFCHLIPDSNDVSLQDVLMTRWKLEIRIDPSFVAICFDVVQYFRLMNDYEEALRFIRLGKSLVEEAEIFGRGVEIAVNLQEAIMIRKTGDYSQALEVLYGIRDQTVEVHDEESNEFASVLNQIGLTVIELGRAGEAQRILENARGIARRSKAYDLVDSIDITLSQVYLKNGLSEKAGRLLDEMVENSDLFLPDDLSQASFTTLWTHMTRLTQRARFFLDTNRIELAELDYIQAFKPFEYIDLFNPEKQSTLSAKNLEIIPAIVNLMFDILDFSLQSQDAETSSRIIGEIRALLAQIDSVDGYRLPNEFRSKFMLLESRWHESRGDVINSYESLSSATEFYTSLVDSEWRFLNEREKGEMLTRIKPVFQRYYELAGRYGDEHPKLIRSAYEITLKSKAILLKSSKNLRRSLNNDSTSIETQKQYLQWVETRTALARIYCGFQDEYNFDRAKQLEDIAAELERSLVFELTDNQPGTFEFSDSRTIQNTLAANEAIVEIVHVVDDAYFAFVVRPEHADIRYVRLSDDELTSAAHYQLTDFIQTSYYITALDRQIPNNRREEIASDIYDVLWRSIDLMLEGVTTVYLSGDGVYQLINPGTLIDNDGNYLHTRYQFALLPTTALLAAVDPTTLVNRQGNPAILFGDPHFRISDTSPTGPVSLSESMSDRSVDYYNRMDYIFENVSRLPGTRKEVINITGLLDESGFETETFMEYEANEYQLKVLKSPWILHLATHGYFMDDQSEDRKNPLLRSGLLLAGCENGFQEYEGEMEDGILTAYEALDLELSRTKLVVLSACETALGEVRSGEGVYGLQRSFMIAGAEYLLMSLWSVDDNATAEFMAAFYQYWLESGDIRQGYDMAVNVIREDYVEPFYWGAFILMGN